MKLIGLIHDFNAKRELKRIAPSLNKEAADRDAFQLVEQIYSDRWEPFFWIKQVKSEITRLCELVAKCKPRVILEIGTANGGSLFLFTKLAAKDAIIISVDLPAGKFGGGYPLYRADFYKTFCKPGQQMYLLRGNSHDKNTFERVKEILGGRKIDFLFIDGDHTYEGVKHDFEQYSELVADDAIIALHDVARHTNESECKVDEFWSKISSKYNNPLEFIENQQQQWAGIGVLHQNNRK
jgi:predicted O-methyltransferase YrrM